MSSTATATVTATRSPAPSFNTRNTDPVRLVIPLGLLILVIIVVVVYRLKSRAKVRADEIPAPQTGRQQQNLGLSAWVRTRVTEPVQTALNTPWTNYSRWRDDQRVLQTPEGQWGSGHGLVTLQDSASVPRTLTPEQATDPVVEPPVVDTIEVLEVLEPLPAARTPWERWFGRK